MMAQEKTALDKLAERCILCVDRSNTRGNKKSVILEKESNPAVTRLAMENKDGDLHVVFSVVESARGIGSFRVQVKLKRKTVFDAHGSWLNGPYDTIADKYLSGAWEKHIKVPA